MITHLHMKTRTNPHTIMSTTSLKHTHTHTHTCVDTYMYTERERERESDRQIDRQGDWQAGRHTYKLTHRQIDRLVLL